MKTAILFFIVLLLSFADSIGQAIPNAGFENWSLIDGQYINPDGWITNAGDFSITIVRETPGQTGSYALKLNKGGIAQTKFVSPQFPFTVEGFLKSNITTNDSVRINVFTYSGNDIVANSELVNTSSIPNWAAFSISVTDTLTTVPDSVEILIKSGILWGTSLSVDNLSISPITGMEDAKNNNVTVFPNPFTESISINTNSPEPLHFTLYDVTGKVVLDLGNVQNIKIPVQYLPHGIYFYKVRNKNGAADRGKLVKN